MKNFKGIVLYANVVPAINEPDEQYQCAIDYVWEVPDDVIPTRRDIEDRFSSYTKPMTAVITYLCWN